MKKKTKVCLVATMMFGICLLMLNSTDLVRAKDSDYPKKSIKYIIPFGAGGTTDVTSRALIKATNKYLVEPIIAINKPGGGGVTPALAVMNAKPDGYTIGAFSSTHSLMLPNTDECPYKDLSGFSIIVRYGKYLWPVVVRSDSPWKTWEELVAWAKKNPKGAIKLGCTSNRARSPVGHSIFTVERHEDFEFTFVAFKSTGKVLSALLGNHIDVYAVSTTPSLMEYVKEGTLRILAYIDVRNPEHKHIPSFREVYEFKPTNFVGIWGPKDLPNHVLEKLGCAFAKGMHDPEFQKTMDRLYMPVSYLGRSEFREDLNEFFPFVSKTMKLLKAKAKIK